MFRDTRSKGILPYCDTDFDFLWLHIDRVVFYLIPAVALAHRGILSSSSGKVGPASWCTLSDARRMQTCGQMPSSFSYSDPGIEDKIRSILTQSEDSDGSEVPDATTCDQSREATH